MKWCFAIFSLAVCLIYMMTDLSEDELIELFDRSDLSSFDSLTKVFDKRNDCERMMNGISEEQSMRDIENLLNENENMPGFEINKIFSLASECGEGAYKPTSKSKATQKAKQKSSYVFDRIELERIFKAVASFVGGHEGSRRMGVFG